MTSPTNNANTVTQVANYYWQHLADLPAYYRFHFLSRLALLAGDSRALAMLNQEQAAFADQDAAWDWLQQHLTRTTVPNFAQQRQRFFDRYPQIREWARHMFAVVFGQALFGYDFSSTAKPLVATSAPVIKQLLADQEALATLSTFAINFLLLVGPFTQQHSAEELAKYLISRRQELYPDLSTAQQVELYLYFHTHIIIAETAFYTRTLSADRQAWYRELWPALEELVAEHFTELQLDCKLEVLVSRQLCGYQARSAALEDRVLAEAAMSLSSEGDFIVDRQNAAVGRTGTDLAASEHRNVLYLLADYKNILID